MVIESRPMKLSSTLFGVTLLSLVGCGASDGLQRVVVSGQVSYQGTPVEHGQVRFVPHSEIAGPVTIASICDGRYTADGQGGVPVGEHRVELLSYDLKAVGGKWPTGPGASPPPQLLPAKYNKHSELHASVQQGSEPLTIDFELTR